ncbi:hypothetical protein Tco_0397484 [Tanacetum coccineum]
MTHKETKEEESKTNSETKVRITGSMVESSKKKKLKRFDFVTEKGDHVHFTKEQIKEQKRIEESVKAKIKYDKYCDKMLNRRVQSRITNCDVLTKKGPITLKVYRDDGTDEVIPNFKANDLHLNKNGEPDKTEQEMGIDFSKTLEEHDPLNKMNDLARKKRKHADEIHDYFRPTKRYKSLVQYEDHPAGIVLNEPCLELRIDYNKPLGEQDPLDKLNDLARKKRKHADDIHDCFKYTKSSHQRQDFVTIEYFGDFTNKMLYTVQEIFFRLHQGHGLDDYAKTFSSFLLAEGEIVGSVPEPFSLSVDLNIKSSKCKLAEDKFSFVSLKTVQLQLFSLVDNFKLNDVDLLLEAEMKCFSSRRFTRR